MMDMLNIFRRKKKKTELDKEVDELYEVDEDSDMPVHEKFTNQKKIRKMGKR